MALFFCLAFIHAGLGEDLPKVAIVADPALRRETDLLRAQLVSRPELVLIDAAPAAAPGSAGENGFDDSLQRAAAAGKAVSADAVIVVKPLEMKSRRVTEMSLVGVSSGAVFGSGIFVSLRRGDEEEMGKLAAELAAKSRRLHLPAGTLSKITLFPVRPVGHGSGYEPALQRLLTELVGSRESLVACKSGAPDAADSKGAGGGPGAGYWLNEAEVRSTMEEDATTGGGRYILTVELQRAGKPPLSHKASGTTADFASMMEGAASWIGEQMKGAPSPLAPEALTAVRGRLRDEALRAVRGSDIDGAWNSGMAAWMLGDRDPNNARNLLQTSLKYTGVAPSTASYEWLLEPLMSVAGDAELNLDYYRGYPGVYFPEYLEQLERMREWHQCILDGIPADEALLKSYQQSRLGASMAFALCLPQILMLKDRERDRYQTEVEALRPLTEELFRKLDELPGKDPQQEGLLIMLRTAMDAVWCQTAPDLKTNYSRLLAENAGPEKFRQRAWLQSGLYLGYRLNVRFREGEGGEAMFQEWSEELLKSKTAEDRIFGLFIRCHRLPFDPGFREQTDERKQLILSMYREMENLFPQALDQPKVLIEDGHSAFLAYFLRHAYWLARSVKIPDEIYYLDDKSSHSEPVFEKASRDLRRKFVFYFVEHWPEKATGVPEGIGGGMSTRNGQPEIPLLDKFEERYAPFLKYLSTYKAEEDPIAARRNYVRSQLKWMYNPVLELESVLQKYGIAQPPEAGKEPVPAKKYRVETAWDIASVLTDGTGGHPSSGTICCARAVPGGVRFLGGDKDVGMFLGILTIPELKADLIPIPQEILSPETALKEGGFRGYQIIGESGQTVLIGAAGQPLLVYSKGRREWKKCDKVPAGNPQQAVEKGGRYVLSTGEEIFSVDESSLKCEILASAGRKPETGPLDSGNIRFFKIIPPEDIPSGADTVLVLAGQSGAATEAYRLDLNSGKAVLDAETLQKVEEGNAKLKAEAAQSAKVPVAGPMGRAMPVRFLSMPSIQGAFLYRLGTGFNGTVLQVRAKDAESFRNIVIDFDGSSGRSPGLGPAVMNPPLVVDQKYFVQFQQKPGLLWILGADRLDRVVPAILSEGTQ